MGAAVATAPTGRLSVSAKFYIGRLMTRLELPVSRVCLMHRPHFVAAGLGDPQLDRNLDDLLSELTADQGGALIDVLKRAVADSE